MLGISEGNQRGLLHRGRRYLAQMRATIRLTGRLDRGDLSPEMEEDLREIYRRWRSEGTEDSEIGS